MIEFTVLKTKVKISPLFFAILTAFLAADKSGIAFSAIAFSAIHEATHFAALFIFGGALAEVKISVFGINMRLFGIMNTWKRIAVFFVGAVANLLLAVFFAMQENSIYCAVNLAIGIFSLLPLPSTDGGSIIMELAERLFPENCKKMCRSVFLVSGIITATVIFAIMMLSRNWYLAAALFYTVISLLKY